MWKYFDNLPLKDRNNIASLGEGDTALVPSRQIGSSLGLDHLYFKLEFQNPSGSYKDRFASMAASLMIEENRREMLATSSGNTGSAWPPMRLASVLNWICTCWRRPPARS